MTGRAWRGTHHSTKIHGNIRRMVGVGTPDSKRPQREYASEILAVQWNGDDSLVKTMWQCMASCCISKGCWYGRKDKFATHQKTHAGGNATFVKSVNRAKNSTTLGYCSLCTSAPMTLMKHWQMKRHLTQTFSQVFPSVGE